MENTIDISYKNNGSYKVVISPDTETLSEQIGDLFPSLKMICIITDSNVAKLYLEEVKTAVSTCCELVFEHVFEAGESSKNLNTVNECYEALLEKGFNRRDLIIGLGGGVTGDMAAFVASTYMRGCAFINMPTSLLAMADSSVGGKCGVDYDKYKNLVGAIYMPKLVYACTKTLKTLPDREFSSGMAEILKAALIKDASFYEWLIENFNEIMDREDDVVCEMLYRAVSIKQYYVTKDPYEKNERMLLNFGHTIGHALERYFDFKYSHGECVSLGMVAASYIAFKRDLLSAEEFYEIRDMLVPFGLPISIDPVDKKSVLSYIGHDKKNTDTGLKFILLKKAGKAFIAGDVTEKEMEEAISSLVFEED